MIHLSLLGRPEVRVDGEAVEGEAVQRKRLLLLGLLCDSSLRPLPRDRLLGLLWPRADEESARHLLSASLHVLRKAFGSDSVVASVGEVGLAPDFVQVDIGAFLAAADQSDWQCATDLYRGPFLDGVFVSEGPDLDQWVESRRRRYRDLYAKGLEAIAKEQGDAGRIEDAVDTWKRLAGLDPVSGRYTLGLMRALAAFGDRTGALRQARIHEQLVAVEFDAQPDSEVLAYVEELKEAPEQGPRLRASPPEKVLVEEVVITETMSAPVDGEPVRSQAPVTEAPAILSTGPITVAVLPFREPMSDTGSGYLGDGIAERILEELGTIEGVRSVARTSSFSFRGGGQDVREIARALGADAVLEGSVRRQGDRIRVWAQLVGASDGYKILSHRYESRTEDIFEIEDEIADAVARAFRRRVRGERLPVEPRTVAVEAWDLYLRGRHAWFRRTDDALLEALDRLREAVRIDPGYSNAWAGLADVYAMAGAYEYGLLPPREAYREARTAATRALSLDADLASAHSVLANVLMNYDWDWAGAERLFLKALRVNAGYAPARQWYALLLASRRRWDESLEQLRIAGELDPVSPLMFTTRGHVLYYRREYEAALDAVESALRLDAAFNRAHVLRALIRFQSGDTERALRELETALEHAAVRHPIPLGLTALLRGTTGDLDGAREGVERLRIMADARYVPSEAIYLAYLGMGEVDRALDQVEEAVGRRSGIVTYLDVEPMLDPVRETTRFAEILGAVEATAASS